jgi:hypothetical protein
MMVSNANSPRRQGDGTDRILSSAVIGILIVVFSSLLRRRHVDPDAIAAAAAAPATSWQGVSGRSQKNGAIRGSPKANSIIIGSHFRGRC